MRNSTDDLDLSVFEELGDNAREYIRLKYGLETESEAMKAIERFDAMQESGNNNVFLLNK